MKKISNLDHTSRVLVTASLIGIVSSLLGWYFFVNRSRLGQEDSTPVATVTFHKNDTRVKRASDIHWNVLSTESVDCYLDDRIFTGNNSEATVEFPGGAKLRLHPNSLVLLSNDMVELDSGTLDIDITGEKEISIKSFGEKIKAEKGSQIRIVNAKSGKKFIPLNSAAKEIPLTTFLKTVKVDKPTAEAGPVPEEPELQAIPLEIRLPDSTLDFNEATSFIAVLDDPNAAEEYDYVIKNDQGIVKEGKTSSQQIEITTLPDGPYTLSVAAKLKGKVITEALKTFTARMKSLAPPTIIGSYRFFADKINDVPLKWEGPAEVEYDIEISDKTREKVLYSTRLRDTGLTHRLPKGPGIYYFRVRYTSKSGLSKSPFSEYAEIEIEDKVSLIRRPLMLRPKGEKVELKKSKVQFTWEEPDPALTYFLELYQDRKGRPYKVIQVKNGKYEHTFENKNATYWWRIFGKSPFGNTTRDETRFSVTVTVPESRPAAQSKVDNGIDFIQLRGRKRVQDSEW